MRRYTYLAAAGAVVLGFAVPTPAIAQEGNTYLLTLEMSDGSTSQLCATFTDNTPGVITLADSSGSEDGTWVHWSNNTSKKWFIVLGDSGWAASGKTAGKRKIKQGNIIAWAEDDGDPIQHTFTGELDPDCDPDELAG